MNKNEMRISRTLGEEYATIYSQAKQLMAAMEREAEQKEQGCRFVIRESKHIMAVLQARFSSLLS